MNFWSITVAHYQAAYNNKYLNVSKSMGAPKRYLHVQRKLHYIEGQWIFQRKRDRHVPGGGGEAGEKRPWLGALQAPLAHYQAV